MASFDAQLGQAAPADFAQTLLLPRAIGCALQLFLGGIATLRAIEALRQTWKTPLAKQLLLASLLTNLAAIGCTAYEVAFWMTLQDRSYPSLLHMRLADAIWVLPTAFGPILTQVFMAIRCWRIIGKKVYFAIVAVLLVLCLVGTTLWLTIMIFLVKDGKARVTLLTPTFVLGFWTNATVDILIVVMLTINLKTRQGGMTERGVSMINGVIRLAFETCGVPLLATLYGAIVTTISLYYPQHISLTYATIPMLPSLYLLSFVYCLEATQSYATRTHDMMTRPSLSTFLHPSVGTTSTHTDQFASKGCRTEDLSFPDVVHFTTWKPPA